MVGNGHLGCFAVRVLVDFAELIDLPTGWKFTRSRGERGDLEIGFLRELRELRGSACDTCAELAFDGVRAGALLLAFQGECPSLLAAFYAMRLLRGDKGNLLAFLPSRSRSSKLAK
jgi:hypothetical protein